MLVIIEILRGKAIQSSESRRSPRSRACALNEANLKCIHHDSFCFEINSGITFQ